MLDFPLDTLLDERGQKESQITSRYFCYAFKGILWLTFDRMDLEQILRMKRGIKTSC